MAGTQPRGFSGDHSPLDIHIRLNSPVDSLVKRSQEIAASMQVMFTELQKMVAEYTRNLGKSLPVLEKFTKTSPIFAGNTASSTATKIVVALNASLNYLSDLMVKYKELQSQEQQLSVEKDSLISQIIANIGQQNEQSLQQVDVGSLRPSILRALPLSVDDKQVIQHYRGLAPALQAHVSNYCSSDVDVESSLLANQNVRLSMMTTLNVPGHNQQLHTAQIETFGTMFNMFAQQALVGRLFEMEQQHQRINQQMQTTGQEISAGIEHIGQLMAELPSAAFTQQRGRLSEMQQQWRVLNPEMSSHRGAPEPLRTTPASLM